MSKSVLVVEDDLDIRDCLKNILEMEGYSVREAAHGEEALEILKETRPGLILLDLNMPVLCGKEFLKRLPPGSSPVLVMTALPGDPLDGADFLRKPLDLDLLLRKVESLCEPPLQ